MTNADLWKATPKRARAAPSLESRATRAHSVASLVARCLAVALALLLTIPAPALAQHDEDDDGDALRRAALEDAPRAAEDGADDDDASPDDLTPVSRTLEPPVSRSLEGAVRQGAQDEAFEPRERPVPDYDGRGEEPMSAAEGALWVPRVLFYPVYLVSEYVVRRPIGWVVTEAERNDWPRLIFDFFTFDEGKIGIIPTAFYEFGFKPSVGFYLWWNDFLVDDNDLMLNFAFWGEDWLHLRMANRLALPLEGSSIAARIDLKRRQDAKFFGIGPSTDNDDKSRFELTHIEGGLEFQSRIAEQLGVRVGSNVLSETFGRPDSEDRSVHEAVDEGIFEALPPGFDGFAAYRTTLDLWFDSRAGERPSSETGVRVSSHAEHAVSLDDPDALQWVRYGAGVGGYLNLGFYRTVGLSLQTAFADPLLDQEVPFTQLVSIGGSDFSTNVVGDRLLGRSATWATLEYLWPVWVWLDGQVNVSFGNAFGPHLEDFEWDLLRWSVGFGFATVGEPNQTFEMTFGFLGDTFEDGGGLDEFRFFVGANSAF